MMILIFLGSWRSTLIIAVSIPLSILPRHGLELPRPDHQHHDPGRAWRWRSASWSTTRRSPSKTSSAISKKGTISARAILDGAAQIAVPALVSTLCICIVFLPMFFLNGVARYLFVPLAEAVVFAMLASYILSRTWCRPGHVSAQTETHDRPAARAIRFALFQRAFERGFERLRLAYHGLLSTLCARRIIFVPVFLGSAAWRPLLLGALARPGFLPEHR